ncbi:hypothetical protein FRAHR75_1630005 [Frankia sp. Hr75.2]|nr:hypothetical protein FRAHR75_1630005 [Frankia sp. Hr75.2]
MDAWVKVAAGPPAPMRVLGDDERGRHRTELDTVATPAGQFQWDSHEPPPESTSDFRFQLTSLVPTATRR